MTAALRLLRDSFSPSRQSLLSPALDTLMMGGASIVFYLLWLYCFPYASYAEDARQMVPVAAALLFYVFNTAHVAASYRIAYGGFWRRVLPAGEESAGMTARYLWMGVVAPILLLGYMVFAFLHERQAAMQYLGYLFAFMFFIVGWHYIKQVYGCIVVTSALRKIYYGRAERFALLLALYAIWIATFSASNLGEGLRMREYLDVPYPHLNLDALSQSLFGTAHISLPALFFYGPRSLTVNIVSLCYHFTVFSTAAWAVYVLAGKFIREGKRPPAAAVAAFVSIYLWLVPVFYEPYLVYLLVFFHSLQYLPFVLARERNASLAAMRREGQGPLDMEREDRVAARQVNRQVLWAMVLVPCLLVAGASSGLFGVAVPDRITEEGVATLSGLLGIASSLAGYLDAGIPGLVSPLAVAAVVTLAAWALYPLGRGLLARQHPAARRVCGSFLWAVALGFTAYYGLPVLLGYAVPLEQYSGWLFLSLFHVFLNIHHYIIDNVIWKKGNRPVVHYLFSTRRLDAPPARVSSLRYAHG